MPENETIEIWKPVKGYPNYEVSNLGNVRNTAGKLLKPSTKKNGYDAVNLYKDKKMKTVYVHRLVADVFNDNPMGFNEINHINEVKNDNRSENLQHCSHVFNCNYSANRNAKIAKCDLETGEILEIFNNQPEILKSYPNYNRVNICLNLNNHTKSAYGFFWKFLPAE